MSHDSDGIGAALFGLCAGPVMFWKGFQDLKVKRLIEAIPTSKVRSMAMGTVELCGTIDANVEDLLSDPIYGKEAVFYRIEIEEYRSSGKSGHWDTIHTADTTGRPFWLVDDTGRVLVNPKGADDYYKVDLKFETGLFHNPDPLGVAYLDKVVGASSMRTRRLTARFVRSGDPFYVLGCAMPLDQAPPWHHRVAAAVKETLQDAVRKLKADPARMKELDANKDDVVDPAEWDAGVARLRAELEKSAASSQDAGGEGDYVAEAVIRPTTEGLLVLADESESELESELGMASVLMIWGGPVIGVASLAYLCFRFGFL